MCHGLWVIIFAYIVGVNAGWWPRVECPDCTERADPIRLAAQLGRLDFIAMALAVLGVTLAVVALASYQVIRAAAMDAARDEARDRVEAFLPSLVTASLVAGALERDQTTYLSIVTAIRQQIDFLQGPEVGPGEANDIAGAAGGDT